MGTRAKDRYWAGHWVHENWSRLVVVYKSCALVESYIEAGCSRWNNPRISCKIFVFCFRQSAVVVWHP